MAAKKRKNRHIDVYYLNQLTLEGIIKDKSGILYIIWTKESF